MKALSFKLLRFVIVGVCWKGSRFQSIHIILIIRQKNRNNSSNYFGVLFKTLSEFMLKHDHLMLLFLNHVLELLAKFHQI